MNKGRNRALVIGSQVLGLSGVHNDVDAMVEALNGRGFDVDRRTGSNASREGILDGYRELIGSCTDKDAAVIYYSGHGARAVNPNAEGPRHFQCIVPTDWGTNDFNGILDAELSSLLAQLTDKTKNAAVILDCCHSARMSRAANPRDLIPRSIPRAWVDGVDEFLESHPVDTSNVHIIGNPNAVRLVASEADRSAYESVVLVDQEQLRMGLMTHAFLQALDELGDVPVTWRTLCMRVREMVMAHHSEQRPEVAGPSDRLLFLTSRADRPDAVVFFFDGDKPAIRAGKLLGARVDAKYDIMPLGESDLVEEKVLATARVTKLAGANTHVELEVREGKDKPSAGTLAFPRELPFKKAAVRLLGNPDAVAKLRRDVDGDKFIEVVEEQAEALLDVRWTDGEVVVLDRDEVVVQRRKPKSNDDEETRRRIIENLRGWARAESLRTLEGGGLPEDAATVECGRVEDGDAVPMGGTDSLHVGDMLYFRVENTSDRELFVAIFDIGIGGEVTLLQNEDYGRKVEPGEAESYTLGLNHAGKLEGMEAFWNDNVPSDGPRRESVVVLVCEERHAFKNFETAKESTMRGGARTALEDALGAIRSGTTRGIRRQATGGRYFAHVLDFDLYPTKRSDFLIDRALEPRELEWAGVARSIHEPDKEPLEVPERVAVRIDEVEIHHNKAWWGGATVRVDSLTLTGAGVANECFHGRTEHFPDVMKGETLSLKNMLVYEGPVTRFLDFGIWVSRDEAEEPQPLDELLATVIGDEKFQAAAGTLVALATASPSAGVVVGASAAAATLLHFAGNAIREASSRHIGLYRQSFLPAEAFGVGCHPKEGVMRAQEFSLRFRIDPV